MISKMVQLVRVEWKVLVACCWITCQTFAQGTPTRVEEQPVISREPFQISETPTRARAVPPVQPSPVRRAPSSATGNEAKLTPRGEVQNQNRLGRLTGTNRVGTVTTVFSSLAIVVGVFLIVVWISRRAAPQGAVALPNEVVASLGRTPLSGRQQLQLIRVGNKLVLLNVTPQGATPLTEVTDPGEVDRLAGLCQQSQPGSITATFRQVLSQYSSDSGNRRLAREA